jgi:hypothetical protein
MAEEQDPNERSPSELKDGPRSSSLLVGTLGLLAGAWLLVIAWVTSTQPPANRPIQPYVPLGVMGVIVLVASVVHLVRGPRSPG